MKRFLIVTILCMTILLSYHLKVSADAHNNGYSAPCFTVQGAKYCNASGGTYFYAENNFYMCLNRVNNNGYIIDRIYAQYNPQTKTLGKIITKNSSYSDVLKAGLVEMAHVQAFISGQNIKVSASAQTVAQYKAKLEKQQAANAAYRKKQEEQAAAAAKKKAEEDELAAKKKAEEEAAAKAKAIQDTKEKHQKALTAALNSGTLPSCKKLYWKYSLLYVYSASNPEPFKNIEGTDLSYCKLKDDSTAMLQFKDTVDYKTGSKYRGLDLMDFTGKTKYYPWN